MLGLGLLKVARLREAARCGASHACLRNRGYPASVETLDCLARPHPSAARSLYAVSDVVIPYCSFISNCIYFSGYHVSVIHELHCIKAYMAALLSRTLCKILFSPHRSVSKHGYEFNPHSFVPQKTPETGVHSHPPLSPQRRKCYSNFQSFLKEGPPACRSALEISAHGEGQAKRELETK